MMKISEQYIRERSQNLFTNDDLYDACLETIKANATATKLEQLINSVVYNNINYLFRQRQFDNCSFTHGIYYNDYKDTMEVSYRRLQQCNDNLFDYCLQNNIDFSNLFEK